MVICFILLSQYRHKLCNLYRTVLLSLLRKPHNLCLCRKIKIIPEFITPKVWLVWSSKYVNKKQKCEGSNTGRRRIMYFYFCITYHIYSAIRQDFLLCRKTSNNFISHMKYCSKTSFTLLKHFTVVRHFFQNNAKTVESSVTWI